LDSDRSILWNLSGLRGWRFDSGIRDPPTSKVTRHERTSILSVGRTNRILIHDRLDLGSALHSTCDRRELRNPSGYRRSECAYGLDSVSTLSDLAVQIVRCDQRKTNSGLPRSKSERFSNRLGSVIGETS
jgi:hypothetical protein